MNHSLTVGILQYDIKWHDIKANLSFIESYLKSNITLPNILVLPEMFSTGFTMNPENLKIEDIEHQKEWLSQTAKKLHLNIICSIVDFENNQYFNRMFLVDPNGGFFSYDKRHLFRMGKENEVYEKGTDRQIFCVDDIKIFPQVCYDLRFPVWCRNTEGYHILINVANWPAARHDVWNTLLKARAIENQSYVIGVNRIGIDNNGIEYIGGSVVFNAKGEKIMDMGNISDYSIVSIDISELNAFREKFPVHKDADFFEIKNRE
jgi:predicted amidohydrolase